MSKDTIKSISEDFKSLLMKSEEDTQGESKALKQYIAIVKANEIEYKNFFNENQQLKQKN